MKYRIFKNDEKTPINLAKGLNVLTRVEKREAQLIVNALNNQTDDHYTMKISGAAA